EGCGSRKDVPCHDSTDCDLSSGGICLAVTGGSQWCAYPDSMCSSGFRFSDLDVGDGLGGTCTDAGAFHTLTVQIGGSGAGTIGAMPSGLSCTATMCTGIFPVGTMVQLNATATTGTFLGWSDGCSGTSSCTITLDQDRTIGALFGVPGESLW